MSFQVGIGSLGGTVFSGETFYPSASYVQVSTSCSPIVTGTKFYRL